MRDTTLLEALPFPRLKELDIREIVIHPFQREARAPKTYGGGDSR